MTATPELPVPDAALDAFTATDPLAYGDTATMVRAIAAPVVAAELRRLADDFEAMNWQTYRATLRARADELDPHPTEETT